MLHPVYKYIKMYHMQQGTLSQGISIKL